MKSYAKKKSYDQYWSKYSALCTQHLHGAEAQVPGVQELLECKIESYGI